MKRQGISTTNTSVTSRFTGTNIKLSEMGKSSNKTSDKIISDRVNMFTRPNRVTAPSSKSPQRSTTKGQPLNIMITILFNNLRVHINSIVNYFKLH